MPPLRGPKALRSRMGLQPSVELEAYIFRCLEIARRSGRNLTAANKMHCPFPSPFVLGLWVYAILTFISQGHGEEGPKDMVKKDQFVYEFDETKPIRFGLLPRYANNESQIRWFELSNGMVFHNANAWESGDEVVLVSCRKPFMDPYDFRIGKENQLARTDVREYRFNVKTGEATERQLGEFVCDFLQINESYAGRKSRFVYTSVFDVRKMVGIAKYDMEREPELGKQSLEVGGNVAGVFWHGPQRYGSEAIFVPKSAGTDALEEDDGYLISFVHDDKTEKSEAVVIDARSMSSDPVAIVELPGRVPIGFHAIFVSEDELQSQKL